MEASQASEAGSIPVARSTAWPRAGRFCHASATGTPGQPRTPQASTPRSRPCGRAPGTKLSPHTALAGPTGIKLSQHAPKWPISARFTPAGRTLYRTRDHVRHKTAPAYPVRRSTRNKTPPARATIETMIGSAPQTTADRIQPSPSVHHPLPELEAPKSLGTATSAPYGASRESPRNREVHQPRLALPPTVSSRMQSHLGQSLCQIH